MIQCTYAIQRTRYDVPIDSLQSRAVQIQNILNVVSDYFQVPLAAILGHNRRREYVVPRQVVAYICCKKYKCFSLKYIGSHLGGRDHTTVLYSRDYVAGQLVSKFDNPYAIWVEEIMERL